MKNYLKSRFKKFENSFYFALFFLAFFGGAVAFAQQSQSSDLQQIYAPQPAVASDSGSLINPKDANAWSPLDTVTTVYQLFCFTNVGGLCDPERQSWMSSAAVVDLGVNVVTKTVFNGKNIDEVIRDKGYTQAELDLLTEGKVKLTMDGTMQRMPGGFGGYLAVLTDRVSSEPVVPTNLALFLKDSTSDTIVGEPAYAASVWGTSFEKLVLTGWRISRNIALALLGVIIGISALMVMFRTQMGPRAVVTIYNVLPAIPITLGLILFSYPIASVLLGLITPLTQLSVAFGNSLREAVLGTTGVAPGLGALAILALVGLLSGFVTAGGGTLVTIILIAIFVLVWVWVMVAYLIMNIKILISLILTTMAAPFVILLSAIPGKNALLMNLAKSYIVDIITLPVFNIVYYLGLTIILFAPSGGSNGQLYFSEPSVGLGVAAYGFLIFWIKLVMGFGIIWSCRNMRETLKKQIGVSDSLFGGGGAEERRR